MKFVIYREDGRLWITSKENEKDMRQEMLDALVDLENADREQTEDVTSILIEPQLGFNIQA